MVVLDCMSPSAVFCPLSQTSVAPGFFIVIPAALIHFSLVGFIEIGHDLTTGWLVYLYNPVMVPGQIIFVNLDLGIIPVLLIVRDVWVCFELNDSSFLCFSQILPKEDR